MNRSILLAAALLLFVLNSFGLAQSRRVAMTIDDVPFEGSESVSFETNVRTNATMLEKIRALKTPVTAFITGRGCIARDHTSERLAILQSWIDEPLITLGNHSYHHLDHSKTDHDTFVEEVYSTDQLIRPLAGTKPLKYFRFPYNALGKDSIDQVDKAHYLTSHGYSVAPFTIESVDYIYNDLYEHELSLGHQKAADSIVEKYLNFTERCFDEMEQLCQTLYGRAIDHIFLFHDVPLNANCYDKLVHRLGKRGYSFISFEDALRDPIYQSTNHYFRRYGFSWVYRWIADDSKRKEYLKKSIDPEPDIMEAYSALKKEAK